MAVTSFEKGHWYRYTIKHTVKPDQWNLKMMDVCDGEPCYCIFGKGAYAEFRGHGHYDSDSGITDEVIESKSRSTRGWDWSQGIDNWEEVSSLECYGWSSSSVTASSITSSIIVQEDDSPKYSFVLPRRSDLRAELLKKL